MIYWSDVNLFHSITVRMVQIFIDHGFCKYSSTGFCAFGSILLFKDDALSYQSGTLALKLLDKVWAKDISPYVSIAHYGLITPFHASIHSSLNPCEYID